jgi:hypothetical protein
VIYAVGDRYVISSRGVWLPGAYDSKRAARYAFRFSISELADTSRRVNVISGRSITFDDLHERQATRKV